MGGKSDRMDAASLSFLFLDEGMAFIFSGCDCGRFQVWHGHRERSGVAGVVGRGGSLTALRLFLLDVNNKVDLNFNQDYNGYLKVLSRLHR